MDSLFPAPPTSLSLPNSHRTFHDLRIRGRLRSLATAYYPPVVLDLRIVEQGRIRGPGHVGVARGRRRCYRSRSSSRSRSRGRERRLRSSPSAYAFSLPAGEIGVTACGRPLSRIARSQVGDYLALLPACGRRSQDGWPDVRPRRVLGRLPRSLLWFLKRRGLSLRV